MTDPEHPAGEAARVGLCLRCRHAIRQVGARGSVFWRCGRADGDARFRRYPPLPVERCEGFEDTDRTD